MPWGDFLRPFLRSAKDIGIFYLREESFIMPIAVILIKNIVIVFLTAVQFAMLGRAILSWFPMNSNKLTDFLVAVTEPFIYPVRTLFQKMNWFTGLPIDVSFLFTYMFLTLILLFLP